MNYEFPPLGGGAGNATYYILQELSKRKDIEIDLITSSTDKYHIQQFKNNIKIYYLDIGKKGKNLHNQSMINLIRYSIKSHRLIKKLKKENEYSQVHAFFGIPCGFIAMLSRLPYIVSLRGSDVPFYSKKYMILDILFFKFLSKLIWKRAKRVIANSSDLRDLAYKTYNKKEIDIIPNGVDINEFKPDKNTTDKIRIISTSRFTKRKGIIYLLEAFKNICKKYKNITLSLIGQGDLEQDFRKYVKKHNIKNRVFFLGLIPHEKIHTEYKKADIFVLPSFNEGMSNSLLEALATGLAIISTDTGGAKDLIDDTNGFIVKKGDVKDIEKVLISLVANKEKLNKMKTYSRQKALSISWEKVANEYFEIYE